jgi:hypothetical protein
MPAGLGIAAIGGSVAGAANASANTAAGAQIAQQAAGASNQVASTNYGQATTNLNPYVAAGGNAAAELSGLTTAGAGSQAATSALNNYLNSEQYGFQYNQGQQAVQTSNATALNSGATDKALINYGQGEAGSALAGYEGVLENQTGTGESAASNLGSLGQSEAQLISSNNLTSAGDQISALNNESNIDANLIKGITTAGNSAVTGSSFGSSALSSAAQGVGSLVGSAAGALGTSFLPEF